MHRCYDEDFTSEGRDYPAGVYLHTVKKGEGKGAADIPLNIKFSSPIKAAAITRTKEKEEHSLLLDFVPVRETEWKKILISRASLVATKSDEARTKLADAGVDFLSGNWETLHGYLEHLKPETVGIKVIHLMMAHPQQHHNDNDPDDAPAAAGARPR